MAHHANFVIVEDDLLNEEPLVIKDVGPHDKHLTVTNDAEDVVERLYASGDLNDNRRLFYIDSEGSKDEIVHADGKFTGFRAGAR